jgi:hypothetical protein
MIRLSRLLKVRHERPVRAVQLAVRRQVPLPRQVGRDRMRQHGLLKLPVQMQGDRQA